MGVEGRPSCSSLGGGRTDPRHPSGQAADVAIELGFPRESTKGCQGGSHFHVPRSVRAAKQRDQRLHSITAVFAALDCTLSIGMSSFHANRQVGGRLDCAGAKDSGLRSAPGAAMRPSRSACSREAVVRNEAVKPDIHRRPPHVDPAAHRVTADFPRQRRPTANMSLRKGP
jgi:hypothetical protein